MSFVKNLVKTVHLVGKRNCHQLAKCTNITYSATRCLNRYNVYTVSENRCISNLQKYNRFLSTLNSSETHADIEVLSDLRRDFMAIYPDFIKDLTENVKYSDADASKWLEKVLQYNLQGGSRIRSLITILSYKSLEKPENLTPENLHLANVMGWCTELGLAYMCMFDDIMDRSTMRYNVPCWYSLPENGLSAINDALFIQSSMYFALKKNFQDKSYYKDVLNLFNEILLRAITGQFFDMSGCKGYKCGLSNFTMDRYSVMIKYKTAFATINLPVALAMSMCGINNFENHHQAKTVLLEMGKYYQIQNDFLDCFGNQALIGKPGNDIQEGKCTWLSVVALQKANLAQKQLMEKYYGSKDPEHIAMIKNLYEKLAIPQEYAIYKETTYNMIKNQIEETIRGLPHDLFFKILDIVFKGNTKDHCLIE